MIKLLYTLIFILFLNINSSFSQVNKQVSHHKKKTIKSSRLYTQLNLTLFIEGYYIQNKMMKPTLKNQHKSANIDIVDTVEIRLHDSKYPYKIKFSKHCLLYTNGKIKCNFLQQEGQYYISIKYKNCIETWSICPIQLKSRKVSYNFSTHSKQAIGNNMVEVENGVWAFYSGDVNQDGIIDIKDCGITEKDINNFLFGFYKTDINGDENVDLLDLKIIELKLDVNKDQTVNALDFEMIKNNPHLQFKVKRPPYRSAQK